MLNPPSAKPAADKNTGRKNKRPFSRPSVPTPSNPANTNAPGKERSAAIDILRAVSILYIVGFWHLFNYAPVLPGYENGVTYRLTVAVLGLFTLISGYLIGKKDIRLTRAQMGSFYKSRLLRLYPPYLVAIAAFAVLNIATLEALGKSVVLGSMLFGPPPFTLWFMVMLLGCYILAPLFIRARENVVNFTLLTGGTLVILLAFDAVTGTLDPRMVIYLPAFATGVFMAGHRDKLRPAHWAALAFTAVAGLGLTFFHTAPIEQSYTSILFAAAVPALFLCITMLFDTRLSTPRWIEYVGYASFFLYLFHRPVYKVMTYLALPETPALQAVFLLGICLPAAVAVAWTGQKTYDWLLKRYLPAAR